MLEIMSRILFWGAVLLLVAATPYIHQWHARHTSTQYRGPIGRGSDRSDPLLVATGVSLGLLVCMIVVTVVYGYLARG